MCRQLLALPGLDGLSGLFRDTGLWQCAVYFRLLAPSLAMILLSRISFARVQLRCFSAPLWNLPCHDR